MKMSDGTSLVVSQPGPMNIRPFISPERLASERLTTAADALDSADQIVVAPTDLDDWFASTDAGAFISAAAGAKPVSYLLRSPYGNAGYTIDGRHAEMRLIDAFGNTHPDTVMIAMRMTTGSLEIMLACIGGIIDRMPPSDPLAILRHTADIDAIGR